MISQAIKTAIEIDKALVELKSILKMSNNEMIELQKDIYNIAKQLGVSCTSVIGTLSSAAEKDEDIDKVIQRLKS